MARAEARGLDATVGGLTPAAAARFGARSARNLVDSIAGSRDRGLAALLGPFSFVNASQAWPA